MANITCEEISSLVMRNSGSIAFLIGNGIHNYEQYEKHISGKVNWKELIIKVRDELFPDKKDFFSNNTSSLPSQFDSIVWEKNKTDLERHLKETPNYSFPLVDGFEKFCGFKVFSSSDIPNLQQSDTICYLNRLCQNDVKLQKVEEEIRTQVGNIMASVGINLNPNSFAAQLLVIHIMTQGNTDDFVAKQIIKILFENYTLQEWIVPFLQVAEAINSPILTTNYDTSLSKLVHLSPRITVGTNHRFQEGFPFETYFAPSPINHPWDSFAIWHIHGLYNYVNSIRIGQIDYENLLREIQQRLHETTNPLNDNHWESNNSWLSIVFRKKLFIIGLGLEADEKVLWWLLKERAKYGLKGWYVCRETEELSNEKICNLQDAGLNVVKADNVDLYENVWKILLSKLGGVKTKEYQ